MNEAAASSGSRGSLERAASAAEAASQLERRSSRFEAPKRDEEAETNRKIKAKRARETRRSTQGVTQDDVKAAEATLKTADSAKTGSTTEEKVSQPTGDTTSNKLQPTGPSETPSSEDKTEEPSRRRAWQRVCSKYLLFQTLAAVLSLLYYYIASVFQSHPYGQHFNSYIFHITRCH